VRINSERVGKDLAVKVEREKLHPTQLRELGKGGK